jgi:hypothetical protein
MYELNHDISPKEKEMFEKKRRIANLKWRLYAGLRKLTVNPLFIVFPLSIVFLFVGVLLHINIPLQFNQATHFYIALSVLIVVSLILLIGIIFIIGNPCGKRGARAFQIAMMSIKLLTPRGIIILLWRERIFPTYPIFRYCLFIWGVTLEKFTENKSEIENVLDITITGEIELAEGKSQNRITFCAKNGKPTQPKPEIITDPMFKGGD